MCSITTRCWKTISAQAAHAPATPPAWPIRYGRASRLLRYLALLLAGLPALAQQPADSPTTQPGTESEVPLPVLYRHFLAYQNHLDRVAADLVARGKDGSDFRDHYQRALGFTSSQYAIVRDAAVRLEAQMKRQDDIVKALLAELRPTTPMVIKSPKDLPPVPPILLELQEERKAIIEHEVAALKASLGPELSARLDTLLRQNFAASMQVRPVAPLGSMDTGGRVAAS